MVGVSAMAISKFERDEAAPRQSTLLRLAKALSVGVEFFFRQTVVDKVTPAYRKHSRLGTRLGESLQATITETAERYIMAEELFPDGSFPQMELPHLPVHEVSEAEEAARQVRQAWSLGDDPINDLCGTLEDRGVRVIPIDGPRGFDGFSCWANDRIPVIAFNSNVAGDRQRFDLAHELGHLVMDVGEDTDVEKAANRFAGAFLAPAKSVLWELGNKRTNLSFDELLLLKEEYGLSMAAWIHRGHDLSVIDDSTYIGLFKRLGLKGWRAQEPGTVATERPARLQLLVHQALAENLVTPSHARTLLGAGSVAHVFKLEAPSSELVKKYSEDAELRSSLDVGLDDPETAHGKDK